MINYHFHDQRSSDGAGPLARHCEAAVGAGIRYVCVTNHAEVMDPGGSWKADLCEMRERFLAERRSVLECRRLYPTSTFASESSSNTGPSGPIPSIG